MTDISKASVLDLNTLACLAAMMWTDHTVEELEKEFAEIMEKGSSAFFIIRENGLPLGFAQCQLRRDYVEGTDSSPVGYLEGIFVKEEYRKRGYAHRLLTECESWAKTQGCTEFASDCELHNTTSLKFHLSMGFEEANRIICFTKKL